MLNITTSGIDDEAMVQMQGIDAAMVRRLYRLARELLDAKDACTEAALDEADADGAEDDGPGDCSPVLLDYLPCGFWKRLRAAVAMAEGAEGIGHLTNETKGVKYGQA